MRNAACLVAEKTTIGSFLKFYRVGVGILDKIFKGEYEQTIPSHLGFRTNMENIYIFRDGNGIRVPRPKPLPLPSLNLTALVVPLSSNED